MNPCTSCVALLGAVESQHCTELKTSPDRIKVYVQKRGPETNDPEENSVVDKKQQQKGTHIRN